MISLPKSVGTGYSRLRPVMSAVMLAFVGFWIAGITAALSTFWVYGIGSWVGAPLGFAFGLWYGWRCPLRDATIMFVCYSAVFALVAWQERLSSGDPAKDLEMMFVWDFVAGPVSFCLLRLPLLWLSFAHRRILAMVLATLWALVCVVGIYLWLWVWPPRSYSAA